MINVIDEVLDGEELFSIIPVTDSYGNTVYKIQLATRVETPGTPINKVLFDSIMYDLNSRLPIEDKATQSEAEAGTDDTKYMTPLKVKQAINKVLKLTQTSLDFPVSITLNDYISDDTVLIEIECYGSKFEDLSFIGRWEFEGTIHYLDLTNASTPISSVSNAQTLITSSRRYKDYFKLILDIKNNLFKLIRKSASGVNGDVAYDCVEIGYCDLANWGTVHVRSLSDGANGYFHINVYDSDEISSL